MKKILSLFLIYSLVITNLLLPVTSLAYDMPAPPDAPQTPETPSNTSETPQAPAIPDAPSLPNTTDSSTDESADSPVVSPTPQPTPPPTYEEWKAQQEVKQSDEVKTEERQDDATSGSTTSAPAGSLPPISAQGETTGTQEASYANGSNTINTGDADSTAILTNSANINSSEGGGGGSQDVNVSNTGNGTNSTNSGTVETNSNSQNLQTNKADVDNNLNLSSVSGKNEASYNVGESAIISGDANTSAAVVNGVNTNLDGVAIVEFNVDDTHTGDIILAFPQNVGGCTATVCGTNGNLTAQNSGNGSDSANDATIVTSSDNATFQENSADVVNDLVLTSDSGNNEANYNTGGDNSISTGDANVEATVANFVNNNIAGAGEVLVAVVNIFGDLIGNILLPESTLAGNSTTAANTGNGSGSANTASIDTTNNNLTSQTNQANIANNIGATATSGANSAENNTAGFSNGENVIETGDASVDINAITIANNNILDGATWWIVFVNDASGNWVGRIVGSPDDAAMAGSAGTEFIVAADGTILAKNNGNGADSSNTASVTNTQTNETVQTNQANITNNLTLNANSGSNETKNNTGGANAISTGDANVMANIINFVNNNFIGGNVVVSIVNVFGSWLGSFVPPGQEAPSIAANIGGDNRQSASSNGNSDQNHENSNTTANENNSSVSGNEISGETNQNNVFGTVSLNNSNFGQGAQNGSLASGTVVYDDTITVPEGAKVKGVSTGSPVPGWFWKLFGALLALLVIKKLYTPFLRRFVPQRGIKTA